MAELEVWALALEAISKTMKIENPLERRMVNLPKVSEAGTLSTADVCLALPSAATLITMVALHRDRNRL